MHSIIVHDAIAHIIIVHNAIVHSIIVHDAIVHSHHCAHKYCVLPKTHHLAHTVKQLH